LKAITYTRYGSPDVLQLEELPKPTPEPNQVLVKVLAAATNPLDWHFMRGTPHFMRTQSGLLKPKHTRLGVDIAGVVEAVGTEVTRFTPGDEVFGGASPAGGFAEYTTTTEKNLAIKPENVTFEQASGATIVGYTAIQGLRDTGKIKAGESVLINAASGGVGSYAVQYAKHIGATVTGVCSTRNLDFVRDLGADHVIDYTKEDFTQTGQRYDLIFDLAPFYGVDGLERALKPGGRAVVAGFSTLPRLIGVGIKGPRRTKRTDKFIGMMPTARNVPEDLALIRQLMAEDAVVPPIDRCYPLEQIAEAMRYQESMRASGKVIIQINPTGANA
jgi:NADPH:quinone reductase-like Zn-dependent oxidoreductase